VVNLSGSPEDIPSIHAPLLRLLGEANALLSPSGSMFSAASEYLVRWRKLQPALDTVTSAGAFADAGAAQLAELPLMELIQHVQQIVGAEHRLNAWCAWRKVRDESLALGLAPLVA